MLEKLKEAILRLFADELKLHDDDRIDRILKTCAAAGQIEKTTAFRSVYSQDRQHVTFTAFVDSIDSYTHILTLTSSAIEARDTLGRTGVKELSPKTVSIGEFFTADGYCMEADEAASRFIEAAICFLKQYCILLETEGTEHEVIDEYYIRHIDGLAKNTCSILVEFIEFDRLTS